MKNKNALDSTHWIWSRFDEHNARHFGGRLERPQEILRSAFAAWGAATVNMIVDGTPCRMIWIDGAALDADESAASDSLLHEMIHYDLAASADGDGDRGHGARFIARANAIGQVLGLLPCDLPGSTPQQVEDFARTWPKVQREVQRMPR